MELCLHAGMLKAITPFLNFASRMQWSRVADVDATQSVFQNAQSVRELQNEQHLVEWGKHWTQILEEFLSIVVRPSVCLSSAVVVCHPSSSVHPSVVCRLGSGERRSSLVGLGSVLVG